MKSRELRVYVVNLPRREDRRARMKKILPADVDVAFTSDWTPSFDGRDLDPEELPGASLYPGWALPYESGNRWWDRPMTNGEIGCVLSHALVWERALADGVEVAVVLEDDVVLPSDFAAQLNVTLEACDQADPEWGVLYLGREELGQTVQVGDGLVRPGFSYGTYGYVLSDRGLRAAVEADVRAALVPADEFLPTLFLEHPRPDMRLLYPPSTSALAVEPELVSYLSGDDSKSDTSGEVARGRSCGWS